MPQPIQTELDDYDRRAVERKQASAMQAPSGPVYHYTTAAGFLGIISRDELWFTDVAHLNDPTEFKSGLKFAEDHLRSRSAAPSDEIDSYFSKFFLKGLWNAYDQTASFVICFTELPDDLAQWRLYGDDGKGFCVELSPSFFSPSMPISHPADAWELFAVHYDKRVIKEAQETAINEAVDTLRRIKARAAMTEDLLKSVYADIAAGLTLELVNNAARYKDFGYHAEREIRVMISGSIRGLQDRILMRDRRGWLIPYVASRCNPSLRLDGMLQKVWVGPAADQWSIDAAMKLLRIHGFPIEQGKLKVPVVPSGMPYRSR